MAINSKLMSIEAERRFPCRKENQRLPGIPVRPRFLLERPAAIGVQNE
jgi:hypothetical protein